MYDLLAEERNSKMVCIVNMWKKGRSSTKYYLLFPCFDFCAGQRAAAPSHVVTGAYLDVLSPLHPGSASSPPSASPSCATAVIRSTD